MIRILGIKRVAILFILIAVNAAAGGLIYGYLMPEQIKVDRSLRSMRGQISKVQTDISRLQVEFDQLEEQQVRFDGFRSDGFFNLQDRREAEQLLERIQESSEVISAVASISAGEFETNEEAAKSEHRVLASRINLTIDALDDVDVYRYLYLIDQHFPGHISYEEIEMARDIDINAAVLRAIATNTNPPLVKAKVSMTWRTMIPESQVR
jgi:hypothetical protein